MIVNNKRLLYWPLNELTQSHIYTAMRYCFCGLIGYKSFSCKRPTRDHTSHAFWSSKQYFWAFSIDKSFFVIFLWTQTSAQTFTCHSELLFEAFEAYLHWVSESSFALVLRVSLYTIYIYTKRNSQQATLTNDSVLKLFKYPKAYLAKMILF